MSNKSQTVVIIPARFKSTRLPGKPLIKILGVPMIVRVAKIAADAVGIENVYVATDDIRIKDTVESASYNCIMTSENCLTGTDRVAEAWQKIKKNKNYKYIINCQGDEPTLDPKVITDTIEHMKNNPNCSVNCYSYVRENDDPYSKNIIKMVVDKNNKLLYASRAKIPCGKFKKDNNENFIKKQVAVYGFCTKDLEYFGPNEEKTEIENIEDIEILRVLEKGGSIIMREVKGNETAAVDIEEDIKNVERILRKNRKI